ncbi:MAG: beta-agarase [Proteobacteria bacterium]|nr:beta-agarase [Pseudomonadota bacterium]
MSLLLLVACSEPLPTDSAPCVEHEPHGTGFFRVEAVCDRWWFVPPGGGRFWSSGINAATPNGSRNQVTGGYAYAEAVSEIYGSDAAWGEATVPRLESWGFNTAGSWSRADLLDMPATINLGLSGGDWETGELADWFSPEWEAHVTAQVEAEVVPRVGDERVIGWFLDNEIRWGRDWRGTDTLLQEYLQLGPDEPGKAVAVDVLIEELGSVDALNDALTTDHADRDALLAATDWDVLDAGDLDVEPALTEAFLVLAAERYFSFTTTAIRDVDADHLILGNREVSVMVPAVAWEAAGRHADVISSNNYVFVDGIAEAALNISGGLDPSGFLAAQHALTDKPILITEFGFRAADAGLPNSWPPIYPTLADQTARADAFEDYVREAQATPWIVGTHWFAWVDQPADGRFDGEDNNWGLVSESDVPYAELTERTAEVFGELP